MKTSNNKQITASAEVAAKAPSLSYQGRLAFWFSYFLRRENAIEKSPVGLIKPYRPKLAAKKETLLLTVSQ